MSHAYMSADKPITNILTTVCILLLVLVLPLLDRMICRKLSVNPAAPLPRDEREKRLLQLRKILLLAIFAVYLAGNAYMVFFSRTASTKFRVQNELLKDLRKSMYIDYGFLSSLRIIYYLGFETFLNTIHITNPADLFQLYLNVLLYLPMGFLLPYVFRWFRERLNRWTVAVGFCCSMFTENVQLLTKIGFYDVDDLVTNTLGTLLGVLLFRRFAYINTHPNWRKEKASIARWKKRAKRSALGSASAGFSAVRTVLRLQDEDGARDFYVDVLGFRMKKMYLPEDREGAVLVMQLGTMELELRCDPAETPPPEQNLILRVRRLEKIHRMLRAKGLTVSDIAADPYNDHRCFTLQAPEGVLITMME